MLNPVDWSNPDALTQAFSRIERRFLAITSKIERGVPCGLDDLADIAQWVGIAQGVMSERSQALAQSTSPAGHRARVADFYARQDAEDRKACVLECLSVVSENVLRHWVAEDAERPLSALVGAAELYRRKLGPDPRTGVVVPNTDVIGQQEPR